MWRSNASNNESKNLNSKQEDQWSSERTWETQDEENPFSYVRGRRIAVELIVGKTPYVVSGYELRYMSSLVKVVAMKLRQLASLWRRDEHGSGTDGTGT
ncbi:hypothetical protein Tco_0709950 [Tanacetum coccineum]